MMFSMARTGFSVPRKFDVNKQAASDVKPNTVSGSGIVDIPRPLGKCFGVAKRKVDSIDVCDNEFNLPVLKKRVIGKAHQLAMTSPTMKVSARKVCVMPVQVEGLQATNNSDSVEKVVLSVQSIFGEFWEAYLTNEDHHTIKEACEVAERMANMRYDELCSAMAFLLNWTGHNELPRCHAGDRDYEVVEFHGQKVPQHLSVSEPWDKLEHMRNESTQGKVREALCALLACFASRPEKAWLEALDTDFEMKERKKVAPHESKSDSLRTVLADLASKKVFGYFAHALVDPTSTFRISFARNQVQLRPASLILTYTIPLEKALAQMDDAGPLPKVLPKLSLAQFALQELLTGSVAGARQKVQSLRPEPQIQKLLRSGTPVVMLDAVAALAPRERAREHRLSEVVKAELSAFLRDAKSRGEAVVFMLGGDSPQILAEKVYLRAPFTDHGLRCGYLRWRQSPAESWAREKCQDQRVCIGLQLP